MGITICYAGKIKDINLISRMIGELARFSTIAGWEHQIIDNRPSIYGIALNVHPKCETFFLTFDRDGILSYFIQHDGKDIGIRLSAAPSLSVKTQYAGEETHVIIIKILKYLREKYVPDLDVEDEGGFWANQDREVLSKNFARTRAAIDGLGHALDDYCAGRTIEPSYWRVIQEIDKACGSAPYREYDIVENDQGSMATAVEPDHLNVAEIWTEDQWDKHFKENERLMDKYEKVYSEDPGRAWKHPYDLYCKMHYGIDLGKNFSFADLKDEEDARLVLDDKGENPVQYAAPLIDEYEIELKTFPILAESFEYSRAVIDFTKGLERREDIQRSLSQYVSASLQICAKLHGAHAIGYEMDAVEGNIAVCKIALGKAEDAAEALKKAEPSIRELLSFARLDSKLERLKANIEDWIEELRRRVWWR